jgi:hypothetical protein
VFTEAGPVAVTQPGHLARGPLHLADVERVNDGDGVEFSVDRDAIGPQARDIVPAQALTFRLSGPNVRKRPPDGPSSPNGLPGGLHA